MIDSEEAARHFTAERCDEAAFSALEFFLTALGEENQRQNLVSRGTLEIPWQRHIADSAQLLDHVSRETGLWLDLGTGAGLPGLIIAIMRPEWPVLLVESRARRIEWLQRIVSEIRLKNCRVAGKRLELVETVPAAVISARAFAPLPKLLDLSQRFSTDGTVWLLPKGRSAQQERDAMPKDVQTMFHVEQSLTDPASGILVGVSHGKKGQIA